MAFAERGNSTGKIDSCSFRVQTTGHFLSSSGLWNHQVPPFGLVVPRAASEFPPKEVKMLPVITTVLELSSAPRKAKTSSAK